MARILSFATLDKDPSPTKEKLMNTFRDYVESGSTIPASVVARIIEKVSSTLTMEDKAELKKLAESGERAQRNHGSLYDRNEYLMIRDSL